MTDAQPQSMPAPLPPEEAQARLQRLAERISAHGCRDLEINAAVVATDHRRGGHVANLFNAVPQLRANRAALDADRDGVFETHEAGGAYLAAATLLSRGVTLDRIDPNSQDFQSLLREKCRQVERGGSGQCR